MIFHEPVLLEEFLKFFEKLSLDVFVDGTLGFGGHSLAILEAHPELRLAVGFDQDCRAQKLAQERLQKYHDKFRFVSKNFADFEEALDEEGIGQISGAFFDLGVSSMQLDRGEQGFSFNKEGPLDMRMDPDAELDAREIVNFWPEKELGRIFCDYGEHPKWRVLARTIVQARRGKRIETTKELVEILRPVAGGSRRKIHPMTLPFQALRIAVNRELEVLEKTLPKVVERLTPGGRLGVISYHSLEDRIVKNLFRDLGHKKGGIGTVLTKKPVVPDFKEVKRNPRSRSAKFRVIEKRQ